MCRFLHAFLLLLPSDLHPAASGPHSVLHRARDRREGGLLLVCARGKRSFSPGRKAASPAPLSLRLLSITSECPVCFHPNTVWVPLPLSSISCGRPLADLAVFVSTHACFPTVRLQQIQPGVRIMLFQGSSFRWSGA